jgi:molybdopterin-guanine dinucleotide biosynthesis protein A
MDATLCILAGGESRRMGRPKAELVVRGRPILAYLLERMDWKGPTMLVTSPARRSPAGAERFDREVVDPIDGEGPLRGVLTALQHVTTSIAVATTVDMPCIGAAHLDWMIHNLSRETMCLMLRRGAQVEPFPSIFRAESLPIIQEHFDRGERSVVALTKLSRFTAIDAPPEWRESVWTNLNTPADFVRFIGTESDPSRNAT